MYSYICSLSVYIRQGYRWGFPIDYPWFWSSPEQSPLQCPSVLLYSQQNDLERVWILGRVSECRSNECLSRAYLQSSGTRLEEVHVWRELLSQMSEKGKVMKVSSSVASIYTTKCLFSNTPPQTFVNASHFTIFSCPARGSAFVSPSVSISPVGMCMISKVLSSTCSRMKW